MTIPTRGEVETELVKTMCPSCDAGLLTECTCPDKNEVANRILKALWEEWNEACCECGDQECDGGIDVQRAAATRAMRAATALYEKEQP